MSRKSSLSPAKVLVVGAGPSGLAASLLLLREGLQVALVEAHSKPGGSASYFARKDPEGRPVVFDAGATIVNGYETRGWLRRALSACGVPELPYEPVRELRVRLPGEELRILDTSDLPSWIRSLEELFPEDSPRLGEYLRESARTATRMASLLPRVPHLPLETAQDFLLNMGLVVSAVPLASELIWGLRESFADELDRWGFGPRFRRFVEMNLLITLQALPSAVHPAYGRYALFFYPLGSGTVSGGMKALMTSCLKTVESHPRARVFMKTTVSGLGLMTQGGFEAEITDGRRMGPFDHVVSTLPRYDTAALVASSGLGGWSDYRSEVWGALVAYIIVRDRGDLPAGASHIHLSSARCWTEAPEGGDVYCSFSARGDRERSPDGLRAVTLSTHTRLSRWRGMARLDARYTQLKLEAGQALINSFQAAYPRAEILRYDFGTPLSFHRYTRRREGGVGGLPLTRSRSFLSPPSQRSAIRNLWQIGDTAFPGQSIYACAIGAAACVEKILGRKLQFPD